MCSLPIGWMCCSTDTHDVSDVWVNHIAEIGRCRWWAQLTEKLALIIDYPLTIQYNTIYST